MTKQPNPELWIKLILPGVGQVGPGKIELLRRINECQSMAAAARSMDMSYRRAWLLVDEMNKLFDRPVVAKWQGGKSRGGASLTRFGEKLVESFDELVGQANDVNRTLLDELGRSAGRLRSRKRA